MKWRRYLINKRTWMTISDDEVIIWWWWIWRKLRTWWHRDFQNLALFLFTELLIIVMMMFMMVIMMMVIKRMIVIFRTWLSSSSPTCSLSPRGKVRSASSFSTTVREIWSRWCGLKNCYSAFKADEDDVFWHQRYITIIFKVSELESSEGVPGLGGGDQAGFALWLTLLQVIFFHYFIIFALWLYIAAGLFLIFL